tara:strand:- start:353 stop:595 length:243 start_codon:yes stop_codon:yes gene_type:complete
MTFSAKKEKQRNQVKSKFYYIFWGAATVTVFVGQMYVGSGFRRMATSFDRIINTVVIELEEEFQPRHPMVIPDSSKTRFY